MKEKGKVTHGTEEAHKDGRQDAHQTLAKSSPDSAHHKEDVATEKGAHKGSGADSSSEASSDSKPASDTDSTPGTDSDSSEVKEVDPALSVKTGPTEHEIGGGSFADKLEEDRKAKEEEDKKAADESESDKPEAAEAGVTDHESKSKFEDKDNIVTREASHSSKEIPEPSSAHSGSSLHSGLGHDSALSPVPNQKK